MINLLFEDFIVFSILVILCLNVVGFTLKKIMKFPDPLIPITLSLLSFILTISWYIFIKEIDSLRWAILFGMLYGLSAIGLHQIIKQTRTYFRAFIFNKYKKERRKRERKVSITDREDII